MKYLAYFILIGILFGVVLRIKSVWDEYIFNRENRQMMERRKKLWAKNKSSIELTEELLEEITHKN